MSSDIRKNVRSRDGVYLEGAQVFYICGLKYIQTETSTTCGADGRWTPTAKCYPGLRFCNYLQRFNTLIEINWLQQNLKSMQVVILYFKILVFKLLEFVLKKKLNFFRLWTNTNNKKCYRKVG